MDSSVSGKDEIWFLRVCHHVPHELYLSFKFSCFGSLWTAISDEANSGVQGVDSIRLDYKEFNGET